MFHIKPHQTWLFLRARRFKKTHVYFILHLFVGHAMQYNATNHKLQNVFTCFVIFRCFLVADRAGQDTVVCDQLEKAEHGHEFTMAVDLLHHELSMVVFLLCHDLSMDVVLHHNLTQLQKMFHQFTCIRLCNVLIYSDFVQAKAGKIGSYSVAPARKM